MSEVVQLERHDVVAVVTVNNPPVNALSAAVRRGIFEQIKAAAAKYLVATNRTVIDRIPETKPDSKSGQ